MNPLLEQFLSESRDFLQGIGENLLRLEDDPGDKDVVNELFRLVHTLKGNSGLFEFPTMTRVLHAGEDLMDEVRQDRVAFSRQIADHLLDAMDFVGLLCDEIEASGGHLASGLGDSVRIAEGLRLLIPEAAAAPGASLPLPQPKAQAALELEGIPEAVRLEAYREAGASGLFLVRYHPAEGCFYQGEDPLHQARLTPGLLWGWVTVRGPWPALETLDAYRCLLDFHVLAQAPRGTLEEHYRYVLEQVQILEVQPLDLVVPQGEPNGGPVYEDFVAEALGFLEAGDLKALERAAKVLLELSNAELFLASVLRWLLAVLAREPGNARALKSLIQALSTFEAPCFSPAAAPVSVASLPPAGPAAIDPSLAITAHAVIAIQRTILGMEDGATWGPGRLRAAAATLALCLEALGHGAALGGLEACVREGLAAGSGAGVVTWLDRLLGTASAPVADASTAPAPAPLVPVPGAVPATAGEGDLKFNRRAEDAQSGAKSLKVDQAKVDRLMDLIGEMVVSKNALPYLAARAETVFGSRELSREIKAQYAVINRIAEEMQDAIMQVRMLPVSFVFQRFPRLVRDLSRKLGKDVDLVLVGEDTQADKNIIEALGDPLVHILRNSLDHGFELPEVRRAAGKPIRGTLTLRASQEADRVLIEIEDDGKGIDPAAIKRKAYERGILDEAALERISDHEAINLIFAPGLSTLDVVSDLSGRGVGMDVVRSAVEKVNGSIRLDSVLGQGTRLALSLPLSMAVTSVMIVEADGQCFGLPMQSVVETVRVPRARILGIKNTRATVLRGRIVPLKALNAKLGIPAAPLANAQDELAVLVVQVGGERVGLIVDRFHETVDVILKPMAGVLGLVSRQVV